MAFDQETANRVAAHLFSKWGEKPCPMCGGYWSQHGYVNIPLSNSPTVTTFGGPNMPCVALVCKQCGYTMLVNLVIAGIVPGVTPENNG